MNAAQEIICVNPHSSDSQKAGSKRKTGISRIMEGVYVNSGRGCKGLGLPPSGSIYAANHASDARRRMHVHSPNSETQNPTPQLPSPGWHGRLCDLDSDALSAFWAQALQYA